MSTHLKNGMTADSTGQPVPWWFDIYLRKESQRAEEFRIFTVNESVTAGGSLLSPTGSVKGMCLALHIHEHFTIHKWLRQTAYILTHNLNMLEHIANNGDIVTAQHENVDSTPFLAQRMSFDFHVNNITRECLRQHQRIFQQAYQNMLQNRFLVSQTRIRNKSQMSGFCGAIKG